MRRATANRNSAGKKLRRVRKDLGLSLRDVVAQSQELRNGRGDRRFAVSLSVLSAIETKGQPPTIHRLASLARIYGRPIAELLSWYGIS